MSEAIPSSDAERITAEFYAKTKAIRDEPFHPRHYLNRSAFFLRNDFPELAAADAYRARILATQFDEVYLRYRDLIKTPIDADHKEYYCVRSSNKLAQALDRMGDGVDAHDYVDDPGTDLTDIDRRKRLATYDRINRNLPKLTHGPTREGRQKDFLKREYPWFPPEERRGPLPSLPPNIQIKTASFTKDPHVKGVFATEWFSKDRDILYDDAYLMDLPAKESMEPYTYLTKVFYKDILRNGRLDALQDPRVATLTINYTTPGAYFPFQELIKPTMWRLYDQGLLFGADHEFWKIFTALWRFECNIYEPTEPTQPGKVGRKLVGVAKRYSFFNHSCAPNAEWGGYTDMGSGKRYIRVIAKHNIRRNQEIFISYLNEKVFKTKNVDERREALKDWFGDEKCLCKRCIEESPSERPRKRQKRA